MAALIGRALLLLIAAAAVVALGHGLHVVRLQDDGEAKAKALGVRPDPAAVAAAASDFRRAGRHNADPAPELDAAALLLRTGQPRQAAALLERVVRDNPGSLRGWALLAAATSSFDLHRSTTADAELLDLYGRRNGLPIRDQFVPAPDGRRFRITPGALRGFVEVAGFEGGDAHLVGWAADARGQVPAQLILVVSRRRVVAALPPSVARPDIARRYGPGTRRSGFEVRIPRARLDVGGRLDVQVFAAGGTASSRLQLDCSRKLAFGC